LRRPLGLSRALVRPSDYDDATIAIRFGGVARATFDALGAASRGYVIGHLPPVDGAELDPNTIAENGYDANARALTANVVYWPRPQTIFASRAAFDRLTPAQRKILLAAGRAALEPALARVERDEAAGLAGICGRGAVPLLTATAGEIAALHRAVRPVYAALVRDPLTRRLVAAIKGLPGTRTDAIRCTRDRGDQSLVSRLEGEWRAGPSMADLVAAGALPGEAERQRGAASLTFRAGRWVARESHSGFVWRGRYQVRGNVLRLAEEACPRSLPCPDKAIASFTWSVYDDRLSLAVDSGTPSYVGLYATPLTRVR
jgi:hypothetical protein